MNKNNPKRRGKEPQMKPREQKFDPEEVKKGLLSNFQLKIQSNGDLFIRNVTEDMVQENRQSTGFKPDDDTILERIERRTGLALKNRRRYLQEERITSSNNNKHNTDRRLNVFQCSRSEVSFPQFLFYPYSTIGEFQYPGGGSGDCSGVVVGKDTVLTAGHCVFRHGSGFDLPETFTPAKGTVAGGFVDPLGSWDIESADLLNAYTEQYPNYQNWDFALVHLHTNNDGDHIGDVVGYMAMVDYADNTMIGVDTHVTGYPSSPSGMQTSNDCCPSCTRQGDWVILSFMLR